MRPGWISVFNALRSACSPLRLKNAEKEMRAPTWKHQLTYKMLPHLFPVLWGCKNKNHL